MNDKKNKSNKKEIDNHFMSSKDSNEYDFISK